jgi:Uma2 family endonuclease
MAAVDLHPDVTDGVHYPSSDGKPVGETPRHVNNLLYLTYQLQWWLADDPQAYAAGDMFIYYEEGNPRRHVSPDVFVVRGVPKEPERRRYLVWKEGKAPDFVVEVTSKSTRKEDLVTKMALYRDTLRVSEYFLYDPFGDYLVPSLQGYRLRGGKYARIRPLDGRLPSKVLGLHLEGADGMLRLYDPAAERWLPLPREEHEALLRSEEERMRAEAEAARLRRELEELRRRLPPGS